MEWGLGARGVGRSILFGFSWRLAFSPQKARFKAWISLDFLGFSRPKGVFSMGYDGFSRKKICRAFSLGVDRRGDGRRRSYAAEGRDWSWSKLSQISDFRQQIVDLPFVRLNPKSSAPKAPLCTGMVLMAMDWMANFLRTEILLSKPESEATVFVDRIQTDGGGTGS
jgi:hypothetical protein